MACSDQHITDTSTEDSDSKDKAKKPKKEVTEFYKKQNEQLENYKSDREQIEKNRQQGREDIEAGPSSSPKAPLLTNVEGGNDMEVVVVPLGSPLPTGRSRKNKKVSKSSKEEKNGEEDTKAAARFAMITLLVNISLMIAKAVASYLSGSLSIISSLVDSVVDITSGLVISICSRLIRKRDPYLYPRGRTRLEPLSLIIISVVMGVASIQLIYGAIERIYAAYMFDTYGEGEKPTVETSLTTVLIMIATVIIKFTLYMICQGYKSDPSIQVLAMDHRNDCFSNIVSCICASLAKHYWYYFDPIGAIVVSCYILGTWVSNGMEQISKLSGKSADKEFINRVIKVCMDHDARITHLDTVYVYHFGTKFLVEVHIVLDQNMVLKDAHDISETLQINIESLPEVERAFVHPDYDFEHQPADEHKVV